ncbi:MAG: ethanolamine ammonia-lyase subunit EutC [Betaproteobacteria bacterium]|nr:ethanolamine ammonia-lyase subunit EutC [Betaproteobacteria bacterium]
MDDAPDTPIPGAAWLALKARTAARIALGRSGGSLPTRPLLDFQLAHARARDAVHAPFDSGSLALQAAQSDVPVTCVQSRATDRTTYLQRPDLGRRLDSPSRERLAALHAQPADVAFVIADGLSTRAAERHALPVVALASTVLASWGWTMAPLIIATQSRVALGDEIGALLNAGLVAMLIGERPGLSADDSLGIYLTHAPSIGRTDTERNCISNIRPGGLTYAEAAHKLLYLLREARAGGLTGVALKDDSDRVMRLVGPDA